MRCPAALVIRTLGALGILLLAAGPAAAQTTRYIAFGDSITAGTGDETGGGGYPTRLGTLLANRGQSATVFNAGLPGETTMEGISRINSVLDRGGDVLLLMEGTNDVGNRVSLETVRSNLAEIARRAESRGLRVVHATLIPRRPTANFDSTNDVTEKLSGFFRDLAWARQRDLVDPFEVFFYRTENVFGTHYSSDAGDSLHPNGRGYDLLARTFADVLTDADTVSPVTAFVDPRDGEESVPGSTPLRIDLYDFGTGIDLTSVRLVINGAEVAAPSSGSESKAEIRYAPEQPFSGVVTFGIRARDKASPANTIDRELARFIVAGTTFLRGDVDRNGRVDGADLLALALKFGAQRGDTRFSANVDLNDDEIVDGDDLAILANNFGRSSA